MVVVFYLFFAPACAITIQAIVEACLALAFALFGIRRKVNAEWICTGYGTTNLLRQFMPPSHDIRMTTESETLSTSQSLGTFSIIATAPTPAIESNSHIER